ncbi:MAG: dihydrofolate reductase family protein [Gaiellales bacterium]
MDNNRAIATRFVYYVASSLDGRIAGPDHDLAFLDSLEGDAGEPDDYARFEASVDALVMGARTWDFLVGYGSWPYGDRPVWVVTHASKVARLDGATMALHRGPIVDLVERLRADDAGTIWIVGGGNLAAQFVTAGALDEIILTVAPRVVGLGPALVDSPEVLPDVDLELVELRRHGHDGVRAVYRRRPAADEPAAVAPNGTQADLAR